MSVWLRLMAWLRVFWACRVALLLAFAGFVFVAIQPASDLLLDVRVTGSWAYWLLFFVAFVIWSVTLYVSARLSLVEPSWALSLAEKKPVSAERYERLRALYLWPTRIVPIVIPALGAGVVIAALILARSNVPDLPESQALEGAVERHLIYTALFSALYTVLALIGILFLYRVLPFMRGGPRWPPFLPGLAVEGAEGGRVSLPTERRTISPWFKITAWVTFGGVTLVLVLFLARPALVEEFQRAALAFVLLSLWIPLLTLLSIGSERLRFPLFLTVVGGALVLFTLVGDNHDVRTVRAEGVHPDERPSVDEWIARWREAVGCPETGTCPTRPILVSASGGASRAAFFTTSVLGRLMDLTCTGAPGDCAGGQPAFVNQVFAISSVSGSTLGAAAWIAALDRAEALERAGRPGLPCKARYEETTAFPDDPIVVIAEWFGRIAQLIATGSAPSGDRHAFEFWHGAAGAEADGAPLVETWQDCLELTVSGDYLSAAVGTLLVRDVLPVPFWNDRNRALEDAFDRHMSTVLRSAGDGAPEESILSREFLTLWRRQIERAEDDGQEAPWRPLLVSNGSSVRYGNRILTVPIGAEENWPFLDGTDAHSLINYPEGADEVACGLPVKTAISNSARFPIVSTEGDFPLVSQGEPPPCVRESGELFGEERNADQVVDGGYYESIGLTSVYDLAFALKAAKLNPFVLVITNDPAVSLACPRVREAAPESVGGAFLTPVEAVSSARSARGALSLEALKQLARFSIEPRTAAAPPVAMMTREARPAEPSVESAADRKAACLRADGRNLADDFAFIDVVAAKNVDGELMPSISLNWWLSRPVQILLRQNVGADHNTRAFAGVCRIIADVEARGACLRAVERAPALRMAEHVQDHARK